MVGEIEMVVKIINAVKARECLWNVYNDDYSKRCKLERAWQDVSDEVGKAEHFCKEKWRNVRTGFIRSLQSNSNQRGVADEQNSLIIGRKRFYLYDQIKFLLPSLDALQHTRKRKKCSNDDKVYAYEFSEDSAQPDDYAALAEYYGHDNSSSEKLYKNPPSFEYILEELEQTLPTKDNNKKFIKKEVQQQSQREEKNSDNVDLFLSEACININNSPTHEYSDSNENNIQHSRPSMEDLELTGIKREDHERSEAQLMHFFRGSVDDILSLSKSSQRLFKRKMLELVNELHEAEAVESN
ncbi:uncharacterized protein LOC119666229 [Teleopsis dalmanni]|uniref:uncharacterized protein LOC119666229 n=1 Tax=Teleopsis dalmanni TaxID=139649 RepID=UPI0018CDF022|nr:uncharacterized protein LOC119666229 [Teleopsis dalmanni]